MTCCHARGSGNSPAYTGSTRANLKGETQMNAWIAAALFAASLSACSSSAPRLQAGSTTVGEQLLYPLPDGYTVVTRAKEGKREHVELVPEGQTSKESTDMIIAQVTRDGGVEETPVEFANSVAARWKQACAASFAEVLDSGQSNGYPYAFWWMACTRDGSEGTTEHTYAKAIAGKDGFYVVQKAWRSSPAPEQVRQWNETFFSQVLLCDSRAPQEHPCPAGARVFVPK